MYSKQYLRRRCAIFDLTGTDSIYECRLDTVSFKVRRHTMADNGLHIGGVAGAAKVCGVLTAIYSTLDDDQEHVVLLILDIACRLRGYKVIATGAMDHVVVDPKVIFRTALLMGAAQIIVAHNHPSNDPTPSVFDMEITQQLVASGKTLQCPVTDHLIVTTHQCVSLRKAKPDWFA